MHEIMKAVVIGVVQALTEFLPVSSSGHMVIAKALLGMEEVGITMEVVTHLATALAVIVYLRKRILEILAALCRGILSGPRSLDEDASSDFRLFFLVVLASIPAALAGLLLREQVGRLFESVEITAIMLIATGAFVLVSGKLSEPRRRVGTSHALLIGVAQAFAIIPGLSRSGLTVGSGLLAGVKREAAFEFALLLSLPAILGASLVELVSGRMGGDLAVIAAAAIPAFIGGYFAISLLFRSIVRNKFHLFAFYLIPLGTIVLVLSRLAVFG
jgi:undecaprenyl-diphosphatase